MTGSRNMFARAVVTSCVPLRKLKLIDPRMWVLTIHLAMKQILNEYRWAFRKDDIVVVVSNRELAQKLHISKKRTHVYIASNELYKEMLDKMVTVRSSKSVKYNDTMRALHMPYIDHEFSSKEQLLGIVERQFPKL